MSSFFDILIPRANKKVRSNFRSVKLKNTHQYSDGHKTLVVTDLENKNWLFFSFPPLATLQQYMVTGCVLMARVIIIARVHTAYCVIFVIIARAIIMAIVILLW